MTINGYKLKQDEWDGMIMKTIVAARFEQEHYVILQNVLTPAEVNAANAEVNKLLANGTMRPNPQEEKWKNKRDGAPRRNSQNPHDDIAARDKGGGAR